MLLGRGVLLVRGVLLGHGVLLGRGMLLGHGVLLGHGMPCPNIVADHTLCAFSSRARTRLTTAS
jgi:hypothetical protein